MGGRRVRHTTSQSVCKAVTKALQTQNTDQQSNAEHRFQHGLPILGNQTTQNFTGVINDFASCGLAQIESTILDYTFKIWIALVKTFPMVCASPY